ncbi:MAG: hypothetical protein WA746_20090, partial [Isosphaeraceae bacterium]
MNPVSEAPFRHEASRAAADTAGGKAGVPPRSHLVDNRPVTGAVEAGGSTSGRWGDREGTGNGRNPLGKPAFVLRRAVKEDGGMG